MAKKGIRHLYVGRVNTVRTTAEDTYYKECLNVTPVAALNFSPTKASAKDYGDDKVVETANAVVGGTLAAELNYDTLDVNSLFLSPVSDDETPYEPAPAGTVSGLESKHWSTRTGVDINPVGVGAIGYSSKGVNGKHWVVKFFPMVQFSEPNDENSTITDNITFGHLNLNGEILIPEDGEWKREYYVDAESAALSVMNAIFPIYDAEEEEANNG